MSQVQETGKAPLEQRPSQVNDTTSRPSSLEAAVFECLCAGLTNAGVPHGVIAAAVKECMALFRERGLFARPLSVLDVIRSVEPEAAVNTEYCVHRVGDRHLSKDQADRIATAIVAEFGGTIERRLYGAKPGAHPAFANLKVTLSDNVEVNLFYYTPDKEV